jgi:hypothetical protein
MNQWPLFILKSVRVNLDIWIYWPLNILRLLCWMGIKFETLVYLKSRWWLLILKSKVKGRNDYKNIILTAQYLKNPLLDKHQNRYPEESITPLDYEVKVKYQTILDVRIYFKIAQYHENLLLDGLYYVEDLYWFWSIKVKG